MKLSTKIKLADSDARDRICNDLDTSLVVEAAAGTGKTTALVDRILSGVKAGRVILSSIVAVTFTEFAAGELKLRLRTELERAIKDASTTAEATQRLRRAVEELEEARIGTIHSFCSDLLREHPVEAEIDPMFEVAPDDRAAPLFDLAFERWFERQLSDPSEGVRRILRRLPRKEWSGKRSGTLTRRHRDQGPKLLLRSAAWALACERDFKSPWQHSEGFDREKEIDELVAEILELGEWSDKGDPDQWFTKSLVYLKVFAAEITRLEALGQTRDYDGIEARLFGFLSGWKAKNYRAYYARDNFPRDELFERREKLKGCVEEFLSHAGADLAPQLRDDLWNVVEEFERLKERAGYVDFLDLLLRARNLIRDNEIVRSDLQHRFSHIFVDEFQDTDPLQAEIIMLLAADSVEQSDWRKVHPVPGKLFIVGDPKQSIYRFRRADVALYQEVKDQLIKSGGALVELNVSFRSRPEIQQLVNAAFGPVMTGESPTQANYVPLAAFKESNPNQPAIVALPVSKPFGSFGSPVKWKIDESLPKDVAAFIDWMVHESGWQVTERERPTVSVSLAPRHICLLFRRFRHYSKDVTREYVQALESHRIPHLLVGGSSFHSREEIEAIRNALTAVEWPDDELAVFATLRGPLFGFTDAQLLSYRTICSSLHPFKKPPADLPPSLKEVTGALEIVRELHRKRNQRPIPETITGLLAATRAQAGFANWATGEQALANIMRLGDMARRAEGNGLISFRAFVNWLDEQAETGEAGDAPIMEEGVDGVRIMTVHKAKGLEFPVVVLVDIGANDTREPSKWVDQKTGLSAMRLAGCVPIEVQDHAEEELRIEKEEAARVLYVAATRARDLLVVSAVGDAPTEGWLSTLNPVIYPSEDTSIRPESIEPAGCPRFGFDNVVNRPNPGRPRGSVNPGLHVPRLGAHRVVWWDPSVLKEGGYVEGKSKLTDYLKEDDSKIKSQSGILAHQQWQAMRSTVRQTASNRRWDVLTATEYASINKSAEEESQISIENIAIDFTRPHGKRFGTLVHTIMSTVSLDSDRNGVEATSRLQGRILNASDVEIDSAAKIVFAALSHPLIKKASDALSRGRCRREVPVLLRLETGTIVEGVVDLAFKSDSKETWTVVDYKTDFELSGRMDEYRRQVALYVQAISRATRETATGVILRL